MNRRNITVSIAVAATVVIAAGLSWYFLSVQPSASTVAQLSAQRKILYWHDPMAPGYRSDKPGKSPFMDMDLVPVYEGEESAESGMPVVTIRPEVMNNLGVRTHQVAYAPVARRLVASGFLFRSETRPVVPTGQGNPAGRAIADIFERDADWVRPGLAAQVRVVGLPGRQWEAVVEHVEPDLDIGTRSLKATVRIKKPDAGLKPNMFAEVVIASAPGPEKRLLVPNEAIIRTGNRTAVVLALGDGRFQPVDVVAGYDVDEWVEILDGIKEGDTVVTSGQFLIDSESNMRANFSRLAPTADGEPKVAP
jgi:hypothetical protein